MVTDADKLKALMRSAKAILQQSSFEKAARIIFNECCAVTGAKSGYVALLSSDGSENEVLFLESGGMPCTVDPSLPMPIRGLREDPTGRARRSTTTTSCIAIGSLSCRQATWI